MMSRGKVVLLCLTLLACQPVLAEPWKLGGHLKYQPTVTSYPDNHVYSIYGTGQPLDHVFDLRLKAEKRSGKWDTRIHYQLAGVYGNTVDNLNALPPALSSLAAAYSPDDSSRLFNLTQVLSKDNHLAAYHRIDRLSVGYTGDKLAARFGRQAISWGNGVIFNPMDIFNPFAPTAINKDYKTGDDLLYGQWLFNSGNDLQWVWVPRRDATTGNIDGSQCSHALKYRIQQTRFGMDLLLARHYSEAFGGIGLSTDIGGAVLRSDITATSLQSGGTAISGIVSTSYAWTWGEHNLSGNLEYYLNGVGVANGNYAPALVPGQPLADRLSRGEVFGVGQDYLAGNTLIELTPRNTLSLTLIHNLNDSSGLLQMTWNFDWKQSLPVIFGVGLPYGSAGSEFGGLQVLPGQYYGPGRSVFAQLTYHF